MPDSGWQYAAHAVNDASKGGVLAWSTPWRVTAATGSATAYNQQATSQATQLLVAYAPAVVPAGVEITGIEFEIRYSVFNAFAAIEDVFIAADGAIGGTDVVAQDLEQFTDGLTLVTRWGNSGTNLWGGVWTPDDFTGGVDGFGFALRMRVKNSATGYLKAALFRIHWEVTEQEAVPGSGSGEGLKPVLTAGSTLTPDPGEGTGAGLTPALVSSFGRWLSPDIPLDPLRLAQAATIAWDETLPGGTAISVQARMKDPNGVAGPWAEVASGGGIAPLLDAGDLAGQALQVQVTLTTTALPATPRFANLAIEASGAYGLSQGFHRNPMTGNLSPLSTLTAEAAGDALFDDYVASPVAQSIYDAPEIDIGFDDRARLWAEVDSVAGPGEVGLVGLRRVVAYRSEAEELPPMHELTTEEAELRYARFRLALDNQATGALVRGFVPTVDQVERRITRSITVAPGGTTVFFDPPFHTLPGVSVSAEAVAGAARFGGWENLTTEQVTLHSWDVGAASAGGPVTYTITGV